MGINEKMHFSLASIPAIMLAIVRDALVVGILPCVPDFGFRIVAIEAQRDKFLIIRDLVHPLLRKHHFQISCLPAGLPVQIVARMMD